MENEKNNDTQNKTNAENERQDTLESIEKTGGVISKGESETIHCLTIIGQIEGHYILPTDQKSTKYEHIIPLLVSIEENPEIDGMLKVLNTMGGDVEAGLAIAEMVASMTKPTVSLVLGGGHSIGVPLAVSAKRSFIVPSATMTIHPVRMSGTVVGVPQTYYYFERMQDRIIRFITEHSHVEESEFRRLLLRPDEIATDVGSIIDGTEAKKIGLIDEVGGLSDALKFLRTEIRQTK
ncbi:MAG: ATP-dependent Clp protease proteolytic subunit [Clostridia bacterium]|nr:ATP-dependent Clp protease proteolytic subunit [Clostridia bacterium]